MADHTVSIPAACTTTAGPNKWAVVESTELARRTMVADMQFPGAAMADPMKWADGLGRDCVVGGVAHPVDVVVVDLTL